MTKILLAVPTYDGKLYCQDEWLKQLEALTYPVDVLIIDNSKYPNNYEYLKEWAEKSTKKVDVQYLKQTKDKSIKQVLGESMDIIRNALISGKYDYWFSLETDIFIPANLVEYLLCLDKAFVGLPYFHGSGINGTFYMNQDFIGLHKDVSNIMHPQKAFLETDGTLKVGYQTGIGCCLVRMDVIMKVPFRIADFPEDWFPDAFFHDDCKRVGIPYYIETGIIAVHENNAKRWADVQKERNTYK